LYFFTQYAILIVEEDSICKKHTKLVGKKFSFSEESKKFMKNTVVVHDVPTVSMPSTPAWVASEDLARIIEQSGDSLILLDAECRFVYVNTNAEALWQCPAQDLLGKNLWEVYPELIGTRFHESVIAAFRKEIPQALHDYFAPFARCCETQFQLSDEQLFILFRNCTNQTRSLNTPLKNEWGAVPHGVLIREHEVRAEALRNRLSIQFPAFPRLDAMLMALDAKDQYTRRHSEEVALYAAAMGRYMELSPENQLIVEIAALLHDIGKIGIPDRLLQRPHELSGEEFEEVKHHPDMGAALVESVLGTSNCAVSVPAIVAAVRHHHEAWNGSGYPVGLPGEAIPFAARVIAVADAFSAMTTHRAYRRTRTVAEALNVLEENAGVLWDRNCVEAFRAIVPQLV
jgi:putative nucleotidyltransferase with HDIG domain